MLWITHHAWFLIMILMPSCINGLLKSTTRSRADEIVNGAIATSADFSTHRTNQSVGLSKKGKGNPYSIIERRVPELIPVLGSQPAGDVSHKPGGRLPVLSARTAVTPATLNRAAATNFAAW